MLCANWAVFCFHRFSRSLVLPLQCHLSASSCFRSPLACSFSHVLAPPLLPPSPSLSRSLSLALSHPLTHSLLQTLAHTHTHTLTFAPVRSLRRATPPASAQGPRRDFGRAGAAEAAQARQAPVVHAARRPLWQPMRAQPLRRARHRVIARVRTRTQARAPARPRTPTRNRSPAHAYAHVKLCASAPAHACARPRGHTRAFSRAHTRICSRVGRNCGFVQEPTSTLCVNWALHGSMRWTAAGLCRGCGPSPQMRRRG
eukprot:1446834-Pleurochrysis_carterae.AAC.4